MIKKKVVPDKKPAPRSITAAFRRLTSGSGWISFVTVLLWAGVVGCLVGAFAGWIIAQFLHVPQVDLLATFEPAATTRIYAADGEQVASYALEQRVVLGPRRSPTHFKHAVVAIEDADFYKHGGVDPQA